MVNKQGALKHLSDEQFVRFYDVYQKHFKAWESFERKKQHALENIEKVYWVAEEKCFHVHYGKTEDFEKVWYHYDPVTLTWW